MDFCGEVISLQKTAFQTSHILPTAHSTTRQLTNHSTEHLPLSCGIRTRRQCLSAVLLEPVASSPTSHDITSNTGYCRESEKHSGTSFTCSLKKAFPPFSALTRHRGSKDKANERLRGKKRNLWKIVFKSRWGMVWFRIQSACQF